MWPPLTCHSVEMASIIIGQDLVGHGAASGPASVASKRSGRRILLTAQRSQGCSAERLGVVNDF